MLRSFSDTDVKRARTALKVVELSHGVQRAADKGLGRVIGCSYSSYLQFDFASNSEEIFSVDESFTISIRPSDHFLEFSL